MSSAEKLLTSVPRQSDRFTTTHWSVVLAAGGAGSAVAQQALERLCQVYWYPLYAFVRRRGYSREDAQDLTQGFFARVLEKNYLAQVQRENGKFRSSLLASLKHFLADEWDKESAQKRGGGKTIVSLDDSTGEGRYRLEPVDTMDAEKLYERRWALTLLDQARERLKEEYSKIGKSGVYDRLKAFDSGDSNAPTYAEVAADLGLSESGVKSAVSRMRQRYRKLVREEVANTVAGPAEIDEEIRYLIRVISE
jgi:RNA polymerase sigma factor (sigma-70 family)